LFAVLFVVLLVLVEIGHRIGLRISVDTDEFRHEQLMGARDAISVLLSLLLGFTLAMALSRSGQRKQPDRGRGQRHRHDQPARADVARTGSRQNAGLADVSTSMRIRFSGAALRGQV
jgi:hypothetical protein